MTRYFQLPRMLLLALAFLLIGFGASASHAQGAALAQTAPARAFVGEIAGTNAFIGIAVSGNHVEAYFCDGAQADVRLWGWFSGERSGEQLDLVSTNGHALLLDLPADGSAPTGRLQTRDGASFSFTTEFATTGAAGLWRAQGIVEGAPSLAGWVVLNNGEQRGAVVQAGTAGAVGFINPTVGLNTQPVSIGSAVLQAQKVGLVTEGSVAT